MAIEIRVPTLGELITEATVGKWFKKAGEAVRADEPLVELETDKVTLEVNAPAAGVLSEIAAETGQTVAIGALLGQLSGGTAPPRRRLRPRRPKPPPLRPLPRPRRRCRRRRPRPRSPPRTRIDLERGRRQRQARPGAEGRRARGRRGGRRLRARRRAARQRPRPCRLPPPRRAQRRPTTAPREERVRMTKLRQTIARRLKDAQNTAAMLTTFNEVDMSEVMALRARYKEAFEKKHGAKLGFMGFFVKACVQALKEVPAVNAEIDGADLVFKNYYHLGIAVGTDKGLIVPVVRDADRLTIAEIEKAIADLGKRARDGQLKIEELQGGTFTITNGGIYGSLMSTPILNAPQSGILGMHKIQERPVAVDGKIEIRPMMYLALELRSSRRRRQGGGDLPGARQGSARRPGAARARPLKRLAAGASWRGGSHERTDVS